MTFKKTTAAALPHHSTRVLMGRLVRTYVRPYALPLCTAVVFMAVAAAMTAAIAQLMQPVLDDVLGPAGNPAMIVPVGLAVLATFVVRGVTTYIHVVIMNRVGQSIVADIQKDLFSHFLGLDLAFFHDNPSGQLISRVMSDVNVVRIAVSDSLTGVGKNLMTLLFLVAVMVYQDWKLAVAALTIAPLIGFFVVYIGRRLRKVSRNLQDGMARLSERLLQIFQGIRQVQIYGMEAQENERAAHAIDSVKGLNIKAVRIGNMSTPVNEVLIGLVAAAIIIYGGFKVSAQVMSTGQLVSFLTAFTMAYEPMKRLARLNNSIQTGLGAAERVFDMMDTRPSIADAPAAVTLSEKKPEIVFENVTFGYAGGEGNALDDVSFTAAPGKVTALVGASGGGKTTIVNLIPRFYDVQGGRVLIGGHDVRDITLESLRRHIAMVPQDITIFDDTVAANIAYGTPDASPEQIRQAAQLAAADAFIQAFPDGYDTRVGEDGMKLSGGQRQRLAIARAILHDAPILLLDEATSALDNESENLVQAALKELEKGRTTIVIAHRLSTVRQADQIIVLDQGRIAEQGTHDTLMAQGGLYARMVQAGLRD